MDTSGILAGAFAGERSSTAEAGALARLLPRLIGDRLRLLAAELKRARLALLTTVVLAVVSALTAVTAWAALWFAVAFGLRAAGLDWPYAIAAIAVFNAAAAGLAAWRMAGAVRLLALPATMRRLGLADMADAAAAAGLNAEPPR